MEYVKSLFSFLLQTGASLSARCLSRSMNSSLNHARLGIGHDTHVSGEQLPWTPHVSLTFFLHTVTLS